MSITINYDTEVADIHKIECACEGAERETCYMCDGTGVVITNRLELTMSNANFRHVMSCLGIDVSYCGDLDANELLDGIKNYRTGLGVRETSIDGNFISCGVDEEYMSIRLGNIRAIAEAYIAANQTEIPYC